MGFTLYSLIEAALLCVNAVAILNEQRVLARCKCSSIRTDRILIHRRSRLGSGGASRQQQPTGYGDPYGNGAGAGATSQLLNLIRSVRTVMRSNTTLSPYRFQSSVCLVLVPLIAFNIVTILLLLLFG